MAEKHRSSNVARDPGLDLLALTEASDEKGIRALLTLGGTDSTFVDAKNEVGTTSLQIASSKGDEKLVALLLERGADVNAVNKEGETPLHRAVWNGRDRVAALLLEKGARVDAVDQLGSTPLHCASRDRIAALLLDRGARVHTVNKMGNTPLHVASLNGYSGVVALLLDRGASVNTVDIGGNTILHVACINGRERVAALLLDRGAGVDTANKRGSTPLHLASRDCVASLLLDRGARVDAANEIGNTPLHVVSLNGHERVATVLVDRGANVNTTNKDGDTPLHLASSNACDSVASLLLDRGASVDCGNEIGNTPLHVAASNGNTSTVSLLLDRGAQIFASNKEGETPLQLASLNGHKSMVSMLLDRGANVDEVNQEGGSPLHLAASNGYEDVAVLLLDRGAQVDAKNKIGETALHIAALNGRASTAAALLGRGAGVDVAGGDGSRPLHRACLHGHTAVAACLLEGGATIDATDHTGSTPLLFASWNGHEETTALLLQRGAAVNAADSDGSTPLHRASQNGHASVATALLDGGAVVDAADQDGSTPIHFASWNGHTKIVVLLLNRGVNVDTARPDGCTPLYFASQSGHEIVASLLLAKGADASIARQDGCTPLLTASEEGHERVVFVLLDNGAPVDAAKQDGCTALHLASWRGHERVAAILLNNGARIAVAEQDGCTPLHFASWKGHESVVSLFLGRNAGVDAIMRDGSTALHLACLEGQLAVVPLLLDRGADVDKARDDGSAPLHLAVERGHEQVATLLMDRDAKLDSRRLDGSMPLHIAAETGNHHIVTLLLGRSVDVNTARQDGSTPLHAASERGLYQMAAMLLDHHANVNAIRKDGSTPLHAASERGQDQLAALLLDNNANVDPTRQDGSTPLHLAANFGSHILTSMLLDRGGTVDKVNRGGRTPLHFACEGGHTFVAAQLLDKGAGVDVADQEGLTPLNIACNLGYSSVVSLLLERGAGENTAARDGRTPLFVAAQCGHDLVAKTLLDRGAEVDAADKLGRTPVHMALYCGHHKVVSLLAERGANMDMASMISGMKSWVASRNTSGDSTAWDPSGNAAATMEKVFVDDDASRLVPHASELDEKASAMALRAIRCSTEEQDAVDTRPGDNRGSTSDSLQISPAESDGVANRGDPEKDVSAQEQDLIFEKIKEFASLLWISDLSVDQMRDRRTLLCEAMMQEGKPRGLLLAMLYATVAVEEKLRSCGRASITPIDFMQTTGAPYKRIGVKLLDHVNTPEEEKMQDSLDSLYLKRVGMKETVSRRILRAKYFTGCDPEMLSLTDMLLFWMQRKREEDAPSGAFASYIVGVYMKMRQYMRAHGVGSDEMLYASELLRVLEASKHDALVVDELVGFGSRIISLAVLRGQKKLHVYDLRTAGYMDSNKVCLTENLNEWVTFRDLHSLAAYTKTPVVLLHAKRLGKEEPRPRIDILHPDPRFVTIDVCNDGQTVSEYEKFDAGIWMILTPTRLGPDGLFHHAHPCFRWPLDRWMDFDRESLLYDKSNSISTIDALLDMIKSTLNIQLKSYIPVQHLILFSLATSEDIKKRKQEKAAEESDSRQKVREIRERNTVDFSWYAYTFNVAKLPKTMKPLLRLICKRMRLKLVDANYARKVAREYGSHPRRTQDSFSGVAKTTLDKRSRLVQLRSASTLAPKGLTVQEQEVFRVFEGVAQGGQGPESAFESVWESASVKWLADALRMKTSAGSEHARVVMKDQIGLGVQLDALLARFTKEDSHQARSKGRARAKAKTKVPLILPKMAGAAGTTWLFADPPTRKRKGAPHKQVSVVPAMVTEEKEMTCTPPTKKKPNGAPGRATNSSADAGKAQQGRLSLGVTLLEQIFERRAASTISGESVINLFRIENLTTDEMRFRRRVLVDEVHRNLLPRRVSLALLLALLALDLALKNANRALEILRECSGGKRTFMTKWGMQYKTIAVRVLSCQNTFEQNKMQEELEAVCSVHASTVVARGVEKFDEASQAFEEARAHHAFALRFLVMLNVDLYPLLETASGMLIGDAEKQYTMGSLQGYYTGPTKALEQRFAEEDAVTFARLLRFSGLTEVQMASRRDVLSEKVKSKAYPRQHRLMMLYAMIAAERRILQAEDPSKDAAVLSKELAVRFASITKAIKEQRNTPLQNRMENELDSVYANVADSLGKLTTSFIAGKSVAVHCTTDLLRDKLIAIILLWMRRRMEDEPDAVPYGSCLPFILGVHIELEHSVNAGAKKAPNKNATRTMSQEKGGAQAENGVLEPCDETRLTNVLLNCEADQDYIERLCAIGNSRLDAAWKREEDPESIWGLVKAMCSDRVGTEVDGSTRARIPLCHLQAFAVVENTPIVLFNGCEDLDSQLASDLSPDITILPGDGKRVLKASPNDLAEGVYDKSLCLVLTGVQKEEAEAPNGEGSWTYHALGCHRWPFHRWIDLTAEPRLVPNDEDLYALVATETTGLEDEPLDVLYQRVGAEIGRGENDEGKWPRKDRDLSIIHRILYRMASTKKLNLGPWLYTCFGIEKVKASPSIKDFIRIRGSQWARALRDELFDQKVQAFCSEQRPTRTGARGAREGGAQGSARKSTARRAPREAKVSRNLGKPSQKRPGRSQRGSARELRRISPKATPKNASAQPTQVEASTSKSGKRAAQTEIDDRVPKRRTRLVTIEETEVEGKALQHFLELNPVDKIHFLE